tara:strand:+ start:3589 stop:3954 length:366 start_codon:yes stop_codon:yes gene_type:complete
VTEYGEEITIEKYICGYSCYKRLSESNSIPRKLWPHIVNKSDYDGLIRPIVIQKPKGFEYLTVEEINILSDSEKDNYYREKEEQIEICPLTKQIRDDINMEDERTSYIEAHSSESDYNDDY